jgi:signal transduction histidine kinase
MSGPLTLVGIDPATRARGRERMLAGVIGTVYRQVPQSVLGTTVLAAALVAALWQARPAELLLGWLAAVLIEGAIRLKAASAFAASAHLLDHAQRWARRWTLQAAGAGALWGAAAPLFFTADDPTHQIVLVAVVLGVAFGTLTLYATHRPALLVFLPLALLPLTGRLLAEGNPSYYPASIVMLVLLVIAYLFGRNYGSAIYASVKNNYENEVLVDQLISEKRAAEEARGVAETATRSKTRFLAAASHDLRQPLQAIGIYVALLQKRAQGPIAPLVGNLSSAVDSLSRLVEELLEVSRLDAGAIHPRLHAVPVDDVLKELDREFTPMATAKGLRLRVRKSSAAVLSDQVLLLRVMRNLLSNAIKYTRAGGVLVAARPHGQMIRIEIWDSGPGIKDKEVDRVFEEFYRGESGNSERGSGGFGLGLSIVKRICGLLQHPLTLTTRSGLGTRFSVEAPRAASPVRRVRDEQRVEAVIRPLTGFTVVVIEDNEEILNSMTRLLRSWGADITSATSFNASLVRKLSLHPRVDLILADHNLGDSHLTGVEAAFRIRELVGQAVPVIMLTAVQAMEVLLEFQRVMRDRLETNPDESSVISRSQFEEPLVLQKPTNAVVLNKAIADALGVPMPQGEEAASTDVEEGREERVD